MNNLRVGLFVRTMKYLRARNTPIFLSLSQYSLGLQIKKECDKGFKIRLNLNVLALARFLHE